MLARDAAARAGFAGFAPDACLVSRYAPGARLSLHQDRDEKDLRAPIVSVSLGLPAVFLWGGASRLRFHGVRPVKDGDHPFAGAHRINITFRKVIAWACQRVTRRRRRAAGRRGIRVVVT